VVGTSTTRERVKDGTGMTEIKTGMGMKESSGNAKRRTGNGPRREVAHGRFLVPRPLWPETGRARIRGRIEIGNGKVGGMSKLPDLTSSSPAKAYLRLQLRRALASQGLPQEDLQLSKVRASRNGHFTLDLGTRTTTRGERGEATVWPPSTL